MDFQNIINNGGFGNSGPMQPYYGTNIVPFGGDMYYTQPQQYYYNQPQQQYVFAPIQQQTQYNPFGGDYYNPYNNQPQQYYSNGIYYYAGGAPVTTTANNGNNTYLQQLEERKYLDKLKIKIVNTYLGKKIDEEKIDKALEIKYNPTYNNQYNNKTQEEIYEDREIANGYAIHRAYMNGQCQKPMADKTRLVREMMYNMQNESGCKSMFDFFQNDLPRLQYEIWLEKNVVPNASRNLSDTYNSREYNQLLSLHAGSNNPFVNLLLDDNRYDNVYEHEMGMKLTVDRETNRLKILRDKLPNYISDEETQKRRREWTNSILNQIYNKNNGSS